MADVQYFCSIDLKSKFRLSQALASQKGIYIYIYIYISEQASVSHYAGCLYQGFNLTVTQATQKPSNIFANMENKNWSFEKLVVDK